MVRKEDTAAESRLTIVTQDPKCEDQNAKKTNGANKTQPYTHSAE